MSNTSTRGREIHQQGEVYRERGEFLEALRCCDEALLVYLHDRDYCGAAEVLASRFLALRHLADKTGEKAYITYAKFTAMAAVEVARLSKVGEAMSLPLLNLAKAEDSLGEYGNALEHYRQAIKWFESDPPANHNRPAVLMDMKVHMFVCAYRTGEKEGLTEAIKLARAIQEDQIEPKYNRDVWASGAYIKAASAISGEDAPQARELMERAKEIIDKNPELVLRLEQWNRQWNEMGLTD